MSSYGDRLNPCESGHVKRKRKQIKDTANDEVIKKTKSILSFIPKAKPGVSFVNFIFKYLFRATQNAEAVIKA